VILSLALAVPLSVIAGAPHWTGAGQNEVPCDTPSGACQWQFSPEMNPPIQGSTVIGMLIQKVHREAYEYECTEPYAELFNEQLDYYEYWAIRRGSPNSDTFSSIPVSMDTEHSELVVGDAQFIATSSDSHVQDLLANLHSSPTWNKPSPGQTDNPVLGENGQPIVWNGASLHSGALPNSLSPPSDGANNWGNHYGGHSVDIPSHQMDFWTECCRPTDLYFLALDCQE